MRAIFVLVLLGITAWMLNATAQDMQGPPPPPPNPILKALDTDGDGVISADEIANASAALKTLDKNGDGKLTLDEICPPPPGCPPCSTSSTNSVSN